MSSSEGIAGWANLMAAMSKEGRGRYDNYGTGRWMVGTTHTVGGEENAKSILWYLEKRRAYIHGSKCRHRFGYRGH